MTDTTPSAVIADLRSDTVTRPSPAMRAAMAAADVGDDQYGEDPTVNRLEAMAAEMLGHEAAVFTASGVMANQIALRAHTRHGDEVICGEWAHIRNHEAGAGGALAGVQFRTLPDLADGSPDPADVVAATRQSAYHLPTPTLLCLEDTHNSAGGKPVAPSRLKELRATAGGLPVHLDGARIFNAAIALGVDAGAIAEPVDTVSFCLSKGLGAPVGSLLVGSRDLVAAARRWRAAYGGAMRQAGVIAAAGVYALEHNVARLADDHARARAVAAALGVPEPASNLVLLDLGEDGSERFLAAAHKAGVLAGYIRPGVVRLAFHLDVEDGAVERAIPVLQDALAAACAS